MIRKRQLGEDKGIVVMSTYSKRHPGDDLIATGIFNLGSKMEGLWRHYLGVQADHDEVKRLTLARHFFVPIPGKVSPVVLAAFGMNVPLIDLENGLCEVLEAANLDLGKPLGPDYIDGIIVPKLGGYYAMMDTHAPYEPPIEFLPAKTL